ncbi:MAG TPA: hypothetical protein VGH28_26245 [Polyangiaceae bacterium]
MKVRVLISVLVLAACADPVRSAERSALGPEDPGVPQGETHRPGQPCLVCHDDFSMGGTIYQDDLTTPVEGATINLVDADGNQFQATSNSVGNFFIKKSDWQPVYPIGSYVDANGNGVIGVTVVGTDPNNPAQMITHIGRDGSCATCHFGSGPTADSPGPVYVTVVQP